MSKLEILKFPDPRLRLVSQEVDEVTPELVKLSEDMLETMYEARGIGLAAPQVNHQVRLLVIDTRPRDKEGRYDIKEMGELEAKVQQPVIIFNPKVVEGDGKTTYDEGCLSVPTFFETVERYEHVKVTGLDKNGKEIMIETDGLLAICLQHEMDHLEGKLFIDRISFVKASRIKNKIKKHGYPTQDADDEEEEEARV